MEAAFVAPCGMNCGICKSHLRRYKKCQGCNLEERKKRCFFHNCETLKIHSSGLCHECSVFPCLRLQKLDTKHKTRDGMSMIENLCYIKEHGMKDFLAKEKKKWTCEKCGGVICVGPRHIICSGCGLEIRTFNSNRK
jgi:hypothetical protein